MLSLSSFVLLSYARLRRLADAAIVAPQPGDTIFGGTSRSGRTTSPGTCRVTAGMRGTLAPPWAGTPNRYRGRRRPHAEVIALPEHRPQALQANHTNPAMEPHDRCRSPARLMRL